MTKKIIRNWLLPAVIGIVAGALIVFGLYELWIRYTITHESNPEIAPHIVVYSTDTPSETRPKTADCRRDGFDDNVPIEISIPTLNTRGCVIKVGMDQNQAIAAPNNIYLAGWYVDSKLPGQEGLSIIDGHISGRYNKDAIFQHLGRLKAGDGFTVKQQSGKVLKYKVKATDDVSLDKAAAKLFERDNRLESQLNLITCSGTYDKNTNRYDRRIIVKAELVVDSAIVDRHGA